MSNDGQSVTQTTTYDAFGNIESSTGSSNNVYRYAGQHGYRSDGDDGLMHVGARYYDPLVGRFLQADTYLGKIGNPQSLNRYVYVENDPINSIDPNGHAKQKPKKGGSKGRGYIDINIDLGMIQIGAQIGAPVPGGLFGGKVHPYIAFDIIPSPGGSVNYDPGKIGPGLFVAASVYAPVLPDFPWIGPGAQVGWGGPGSGSFFFEVGIGMVGGSLNPIGWVF